MSFLAPRSIDPQGFRLGAFRSGVLAAVTSAALIVTIAGPVQAVMPALMPTGPTVTGVTGHRPNATRLSFQISDQVGATVDVGTGNLQVATQGLSLPGINGSVPIGDTFNSMASNVGTTGDFTANRWQFGLGGAGSLTQGTAGAIVYVAGDGATWLFTPVSGSSTAFTSPSGFNVVLVATLSGAMVSGYTLTDVASRKIVSFDADGNPLSITDKNGNATTVSVVYSTPTSITSTAGPLAGRTATLSYSSSTHTLTVTQTNGSLTRNVKYVKDAGSNLTSIVDAAGNTTAFTYTSGQLSKIVSVTGAETDFSYDSSGRVAEVDRHNTSTGSPGTSTTRLSYPSSTTTLVAGPDTSTGVAVATGPHTTYTIGAGYLVSNAVDPMGRTRAATYTPNLFVATSTSGTGASAGTTTASYGANSGQSLTAVQAPGGATSTAAYTNTAPATKYLPSSSSDDSGNSSTYTYNGTGNALTVQNTALAATATLTYNSDGTVATATAPGNGTNDTVYGYDANHQLHTVTPPTGTSLGVKTTSYDGFGRVATTTDGKGVTLSFGYDMIDRLLSTTFSDSTHSVVNSYNNAGLLLTSVSASGTVTKTYDQLGRLASTVNTAGGGTISYGYDKASNLTTTTDSRGTVTNTFDTSGVVTQLTYPKGSGTKITGFATDDRGRRTDEWLQTDASHSGWSAHSHTVYDSSGRISEQVGQAGPATTPTTVFDTTYCYNSATPAPTCGSGVATDHSKVAWSKDTLTGQVTAYTYDAGGRLTVAAQSGGTTNNTYTYSYDGNGNRVSALVTGSTPSSQAFTFNAANQITSTGYSYDGAGNLTATPTASYSYNGAEQMVGAVVGTTTSAYTYAGTSQNEVLSETTSTGKNYHLVYGRTDQSGNPVIEQVIINGSATGYLTNDANTGQPLMLTTSSGIGCLYVADGTGNPVALITDYYVVAFALAYDPYGSVTLTAGGTGGGYQQNPYLFKGGIQDRTTGLVKFGGRWYNPTTGTWTQQDTLDTPLNLANANRYAYASDDPINNLDPSGLAPNSCSTSLLVVTMLVGTTWTAAGILAPTVAGAIVAGAAGTVFTLGLGILSLFC